MTVPVLVGHALSPAAHATIEAVDGASVRWLELPDQATADTLADDPVEVLFADVIPTDLARVPNLRWVQYSGAGIDELVVPSDPDCRLTVTTASGGNAVPIAEYVLGAILSISQQHDARAANQHRRRWGWDDARAALFAGGLTGTTVTLVGYGSIGREVARLARAFDMRVLAVKRDPGARVDHGWHRPGRGDPEGILPDRMVGLDGLAAAVSEARFVVMAAPATAATRGSLGDAVLAAMRPDTWLINVARGTLFDQAALTSALSARRIAGAWLDVTAVEPLPADDALWGLPNVRITPHIAGANATSWDVISELFADNLRRYVAGQQLLNRVGPGGY